MPLPPIRRVVTGHNDQAKAIIQDDQMLKPFDPFTPDMSEPADDHAGFINLWRTTEYPANNHPANPWEEVNRTRMTLADPVGTTVRIVDFPPDSPPLMHRTLSLDAAIVLEGEVVMVLDDGVETLCKKHDVIMQRGTIHAWKNVGKETARIFFMLTPAKQIEIGGEVLEETTIDPGAIAALYAEQEEKKKAST